jgi:signal transduction histidine kinase
MIAATLSFARDDAAGEAQVPLDLADLLQSLCDAAVDAGHAVSYIGDRRFPFNGAPTGLKRAFGNLIDNAIKYGGGARVALSAAREAVIVSVEDDGPGIPPGELEKVFTAFYRVEGSRSRETGGVGLGLAVVRTIVRAHGGEVTLENREEGGLRAAVTLPRS